MKKILLVDDDLSFLAVMRYILQKNGFRVVACSSGNEAIDLINSQHFFAVISDYKMGQESGLAVARIARNHNPPVPVIMLTAYYDGLMSSYNRGFWGELWEKPADRVFSKPVDEKELISAIRNLEEGQDDKTENQSANLQSSERPEKEKKCGK